jgi:hypothetical protein
MEVERGEEGGRGGYILKGEKGRAMKRKKVEYKL